MYDFIVNNIFVKRKTPKPKYKYEDIKTELKNFETELKNAHAKTMRPDRQRLRPATKYLIEIRPF